MFLCLVFIACGGSETPEAQPTTGGGDAEAGTGGGGEAGFSDTPEPVEIDLSGLIPTSGSHLIIKSRPMEQYATSSLFALDLRSEQLHDLNPLDGPVVRIESSRDATVLLYGGVDAASDTNLFLARVLDSGFVPGVPVAGFSGRPGNEYLSGWSGDGRFAIFERGSNIIGDGIDIVDTWTNSLHDSIDGSGDNLILVVAPRGLWFYYLITSRNTPRSNFVHITANGIEQLDAPGRIEFEAFSDGGTRAVYKTLDKDNQSQFYYLDLDTGESVEIIPDPVPDSSIFNVREFSIDDDHLLAQFETTGDEYVARRLCISTGESELISDPDRGKVGFWSTLDGSALLIRYENENGYEFILIDPLGELPPEHVVTLSDRPTVVVGRAGKSHLYLDIWNRGTMLVARDSTGALKSETLIETTGAVADCGLIRSPEPPNDKIAFHATEGFVLIDLGEPVARRVATIGSQHGGVIECPIWNMEGDGFAYAEITNNEQENSGRIYAVRWKSGSDPELPELVYESSENLEVVAYRP